MDGQWQMVPFAVTADDVGDPPDLRPAKVTASGQGRFLFIDVAAMRTNQLRAGARPRISDEAVGEHKLEWVAMEEVRRGLVSYELPNQMEESAA
jgi:DNA-directed RNA polymerase subunit K/omega